MDKTYIDKFLSLAGIDIDMQSDPALIEQVLCRDMMLGEFEPAMTLLKPALEAPVSLRPMFDGTINGIMTKQPAVYEFLTEAIDRGLVGPVTTEKGRAEILRSVHHAYVLNELTKEIVENLDFVFAIQVHLLKQREKFGIPSDFIGALEVLKKVYKGSMFEPTKIIGMDMVYKARALDRQRGYMTDETIAAQVNGLRLNIQEASITDKNAGYQDNAVTGAVLAKISPVTVSLSEDEHKVMLFHLTRKWVSLYETWNLAFCLGNLAYMSVLLPKLLIPAVIDAEPERYLITRSAALWMSTLFHQFAMLSGRENVVVPNSRELALLWGKVNVKYAGELALSEDGHELSYYNDMLDITMGEIMEAMKKAISAGSVSEEDARRIAEIYDGK